MADINTASQRLALILLICICLATSTDSGGSENTPTLYSDVALSAGPEELLNIGGTHIADAQVFFQAVAAPSTDGREQTPNRHSDLSELQIVGRSADPERLTVQWPSSVRSTQTYAVWVRNRSGQWSNVVMVNAPQPVWFSPAVIASNETPRTTRLKVVGRNLLDTLRLRLFGGSIIPITLEATPAGAEPVVLSYSFPPVIAAGSYEVQYSTDGQRWSTIGAQRLEVRRHVGRRELRLDDSRFGGCRANDQRDDSFCLRQALQAAAREKAVIALPAGQWDIYETSSSTLNGVVVPQNVWLHGDAQSPTTLMHHASLNSRPAPLLSLSGTNRIEHLWLRNSSTTKNPLIQVGVKGIALADDLVDIELIDNRFTDAATGIIDTGRAIRRLLIARNDFSIDGTAIYLAGDRHEVSSRFRLIDSMIVDNSFRATSMPADPDQAPIASEIGGSLRLNFSGNAALSATAATAGWRAGFFFHLIDSHDNLLVQDNKVHCAGAGGDGEAIALDNNGNTYAYTGMQSITAADADSVTLAKSPLSMQNGRQLPDQYYFGHWLQVVAGDGNGQARRITGYTIGADGATRFRISPQFSAIPTQASSKVLVSRLFHAPVLIGNVIDNRRPRCARTNASGPHGGAVALWAQTHGAIVTGNTQYNTDGVVVQHSYSVPGKRCEDCENSTIRHVAFSIVGNHIIDEYDWNSACSQSGIQLRHGAAPTPDHPPPVLGLNGRIARNRITHADGVQGGAISFPLVWHSGPSTFFGALIDGTLIEENQIDNVAGASTTGKCSRIPARIGIHLSNRLIHGTVLHGNQCKQVSLPLLDRAIDTARLCAGAPANTCECSGKVD